MTYVYAYNIEKDRSLLSNHLELFNKTIKSPSIILGDFNSIVRASDKRGGNKIPIQKLEKISNFIYKTGLIEPLLKDNKFTWKSGEYRNIHCKLDRVLLNHSFTKKKSPNFSCNTLP